VSFTYNLAAHPSFASKPPEVNDLSRLPRVADAIKTDNFKLQTPGQRSMEHPVLSRARGGNSRKSLPWWNGAAYHPFQLQAPARSTLWHSLHGHLPRTHTLGKDPESRIHISLKNWTFFNVKTKVHSRILLSINQM
jgi:hypothetical protein